MMKHCFVLLSCLFFLLGNVQSLKIKIPKYVEKEQVPEATVTQIVPGATWNDTDGNSIQAHAPGILIDPHDGSYWWYGESLKTGDVSEHGINCYHSTDLLNWKNIGRMINQSNYIVPGNNGPFTLERPKVVYNSWTGTYVMWVHVDTNNYSLRMVGIAVAYQPQGPWSYVHSFQPDGFPSLDMSVYEDKVNGTVRGAYFVRSLDNSYVAISKLSDDYLTSTGIVSVYPQAREGHAIFRYNNRYYMATSHLTGWAANPMDLLMNNKDTIEGSEWTSLGNPTGDSTSWNSQSAFVLPWTSKKTGDEYFIYMGDRWDSPNLLNASYIWLPIHISSPTNVSIPWESSWSLDNY